MDSLLTLRAGAGFRLHKTRGFIGLSGSFGSRIWALRPSRVPGFRTWAVDSCSMPGLWKGGSYIIMQKLSMGGRPNMKEFGKALAKCLSCTHVCVVPVILMLHAMMFIHRCPVSISHC